MRVVARQYAPPRAVGGLLRSLGETARLDRPRFTPGAFCFRAAISMEIGLLPTCKQLKSLRSDGVQFVEIVQTIQSEGQIKSQML